MPALSTVLTEVWCPVNEAIEMHYAVRRLAVTESYVSLKH